MPFCTRCGKKNHDQAIYCSNCGEKIRYQQKNDNITDDGIGKNLRKENKSINMDEVNKKQEQQEPLHGSVWYKKYLTPTIVVVAIMFMGLFYLNGSSVNPFASKVTPPAPTMPSKNIIANKVQIEFNASLPSNYGNYGSDQFITIKNLNDFDWRNTKIYIGQSRGDLYMRYMGIMASGSSVTIPTSQFLLDGTKYIGWWSSSSHSNVICAPEYIRIDTNEGTTGTVRL